MRKTKFRGFTLVELLAVIVILAIILVIAVPQIMKTIDSARLGAFKSTAKLLLTQAEKQHLVDQTLKVDEGDISDVTYEGIDNGDTECGGLAKLGNDYSECKIIVNGSTGIATLEKLVGAGKFANYVCINALLVGPNSIDNNCNKGGSSNSGGGNQSNNTVAVNDSFTGVVYTTRGIASSPSERKYGTLRLNEKFKDDVVAYTTPEVAMDAATQALSDEVGGATDSLSTDGIMRTFLKNTITQGVVTKIEVGFIIDNYLANQYDLVAGIYYLDPNNYDGNVTLLKQLFVGDRCNLSDSGCTCGVPTLDISIYNSGNTLISITDGGADYLGQAGSYHSCSYGNPYNDWGYVSSEDRDKYDGSCA